MKGYFEGSKALGLVRNESARDLWVRVYRICNARGTKDGSASLCTPEGWTRDWPGSARALLAEFFPRDDRIPITVRERAPIEGTFQFSMNEIESAARRMKIGKAPGTDGTTNKMLNEIVDSVTVSLSGEKKQLLREPQPICGDERLRPDIVLIDHVKKNIAVFDVTVKY